MDRVISIRTRVLIGLVLVFIVGVVGLTLRVPGWWLGDACLRSSYDSLHVLNRAPPAASSDCPVVIVYLDPQSYDRKKQDPARPWPREFHAQLLRRLTVAGARAVVFDIVFSGSGPSAAGDDALAAAIRENGRVTLAAEYSHSTVAPDDRHVWARLGTVEPLHEPLVSRAAAWGVASQVVDEDNVVRRYLAGFPADPQPSLTWAAACWLRLPVTQRADSMQHANQRWVRYYGPPLGIPHVSYNQALDSAAVSDSFFRDRIVFIGASPRVEVFSERRDEFRSPYHWWGYKSFFMPGVEIHATEMLNLIRSESLRRLPAGLESLVLLAVALALGLSLVWLRPIPGAVTALVAVTGAAALASAGFSRGIWFPWLVVAAAQIPAALGLSVLFHSIEWYRTRRRLEAARRADEARIHQQAALIDKAHDAILVEDLDGRIVYANASALQLYGWDLPALQEDGTAQALLWADTEAALAARAAALGQGEWNGELRCRTRTGQGVIVASRWTLIRDDRGQPKVLLLINSDITEKKQLEAQFLRTQRLNTIGTLAGGMAHDLNNALAPVLLGVQLLRRKAADEESRNLLGLMEASTHRGADMVRQVLLFARGRGGESEQLELGPLVKELERLVAETFPKSVRIEVFLPDDLWVVDGNPTELHQVLLNLCVNARDAMPEGGRLSVVADNVDLSPAEAASIPDATPGQYVSLSVSDTGTGMSPEVRARVFEPFYTTKDAGRGTGIGLSTVQRIVKARRGFLRVESEPGKGTTFEIFFPRATTGAAVETAAPSAPAPEGGGELVLVVDDERAVRELVREGLTSHGYRVLTAANGAEALRCFEQQPDEIRLLLTDTTLTSLDGACAIAEIRRRRPDLPVVLASGEALPDGVQPGDAVTLVKPFSLDEVLAAVGRGLGRP